MKYFKANDVIDEFKYGTALAELGKVWVSVDKVKSAICLCKSKQSTLLSLANRWIDMLSNGKYSNANKTTIPLFFQEFCNVLPDAFRNPHNKESDEISLDKKMVLKPLLDKGHTPDFLESFIAQAGYKNRAGTLQSLLYSFSQDRQTIRDSDKDLLCEVPFEVIASANQRFNTANSNVIGFPKEFANILTVPDDKILVWGDYPQIDARIAFSLFLMDKDTINCYQKFPEDMYSGIACWVRDMEIKDNPTAGLKPFEGFSSKEERNLYKVYCLRAIYGTVYDPVPAVNSFIKSLRKALDKSPKYSEYQAELKRRINAKQPIVVQSFFGHKELAPSVSPEFFCLNSPIQASSSGVIILTVLGVLDKFRELGYGEDDISVYMVRHDEPIFCISKKLMKDSWVFKDFSKIFVESMVPFDLNWHFGEYYTEESEQMMEQFNLSVNLNLDKIEKIDFKLQIGNYSPLRKHYIVDMTYVVSDSKMVIAFLNREEMKCDTISVKLTEPPNTLLLSVLKRMSYEISLDGYEAIEFCTSESIERSHWVIDGKVAYLQTSAGFSQVMYDLRGYLQYKLGLVNIDNGFADTVTKWGAFRLK